MAGQQQALPQVSSVPVIAKEDKFDGDNYHIWKFRMEAILKSRGLWGHVVGVGDPPVLIPQPPATSPDELAKWHEAE